MGLTQKKYGKNLGYKRMSPLFCNADVSSLDFTVFVKLMPNLKRISLFNKKPYAPSIELDTAVVGNLLQTLDIIRDSASLSESFETINIVKPKTDISQFIEQNQSVFQEKGW